MKFIELEALVGNDKQKVAVNPAFVESLVEREDGILLSLRSNTFRFPKQDMHAFIEKISRAASGAV